jgi:hypothetical protein
MSTIRLAAGGAMILLTLLMTWREGVIKLIGIGLAVLLFLYILRKIADLYWYGKDKNEW